MFTRKRLFWIRSFVRTRFWWGPLGLLVSLGMLGGCSESTSSNRPLPDSTFAHVLTELHLVQERRTLSAPYPPGLRDSIFARHGVSRSAFDATLRYYSRRPRAFEALYQSVIDTLQSMQYKAPSSGVPESVPDSVYQRQSGNPSPR